MQKNRPKLYVHFFSGISASILSRWTHHAVASEAFIYKYGTNLQTASDYNIFQSSVLSVSNIDRAGAAAEEVIRSLIDQLQEAWDTVYKSQQINWRIRASRIARQPAHEHSHLIAHGPPFELIHLFEHSPVQVVPLLDSVRQDNSTSPTVLADVKEEQLQRLEEFTAQQLSACRDSMTVQLRAFATMLIDKFVWLRPFMQDCSQWKDLTTFSD